ncbi:PBP1A family penicillin-binding protein [Metabacillus malikii]|uniref:Penicillin-binding protein 1A n=1 Tax=Metabacillus malikii TaxID=1504265 RepID=A0ABT9Z977_9BACI|nr:PBP1A family penicillin-binding protein [Metabacillus malikii]MDQ0228792.1 penicillin-binding protein 1A [Metabacillus malikii]
MSEQYNSRQERKRQQTQQKTKQKKQKNHKGSPLWKKILLTILVIGIIGMIGGGVTFAVIVSGAPPLDDKKLKDSFSSTLYDINGEEITEIGEFKRTYVSYDDIPEVLRNAFLATEDARFFDHNGVDFIRIGGAFVANVQEGFGAEGGSTITQQVIKNSILTTDKTVTRKVQEIWLAFQLERKYSKQEILEMYLNKIYYPGNIYGVAKAAESFYGIEDLSKIELHEAAMIAGMPQSPNNYNPRTNPESAEKRRNIVLTLMAKHGYITEAEAAEAKKIPVTSTVKAPSEKANPYHAFVEEVLEEVKEKTDIDAGTAGLKIYTTLDPKAQDTVEEVLNGDSINYPDDEMQAGIALIDTKTGEIRAIGGGRNQPVGGFNYATDAKRQPGSTIKPVLDYGPVIEHEKWSTAEPINDEPYTYSDGKTPINNWDRSYKGWMSMRDALAYSRNIPALKAFQAVGKEKAKTFAQGLGIPLPKEIYEPYSIGGFNEGVSPLQMAGAFSAFGNNGIYNEPHAVKKIVLSDGTEISLEPKSEAAMSDYTAFMVTDMMKSVLEYGTGTATRIPGINIAGKTGTTNFDDETKAKYNIPNGAAKDAWFVGYNPNYTAAVWTGYNATEDSEKIYLERGSEQKLAQQMFKEVFKTVADGDRSDFEQPNSVVKLAVEKGSKDLVLASKYTPESQKAYEYFVKGAEPKKVSKKFDKLDKPSGLNISYDQESNSITINWKYSDKDVNFEVSQSVDNGAYQVVSQSKELSYTTVDVKPGSVYSFKVAAVDGDNRSNEAATKIEVPSPDVDIPELPIEEDLVDENEEQQEEQEGNGNQKPDQNNGNGNGNGNQNGNGNKNNNGNNGNGNNNEDKKEEDKQEQDDGDEKQEDGGNTPPSTEVTTPPTNGRNENDESVE